MKTQYIPYFLLLAILFFACGGEEEVGPVVNVEGPPTLTASADQLVLSREAADQAAASFSWGPVSYGFPVAVSYRLQFDQPSNNFDSAAVVTADSLLGTTLTVAALNTIATEVGLIPNEAGTLLVRAVSDIQAPGGTASAADPVYSEPVALTVTPYTAAAGPAFLYVPGDYQGWNPAEAPALRSNEDDGVYVGYVTFPEDAASLAFKLTPERDWDVDYGGGDGTLEQMGDNLSVPEPGTYQLTANLNDLTWSADPYSWGVIGDATVGGWDVDQDLTYDYEQDAWTITTDLTPGEIKFRLNNDWATNYGDDDLGDATLNAEGANIPITTAGTYEVILNVSGNEPTYSLTLVE